MKQDLIQTAKTEENKRKQLINKFQGSLEGITKQLGKWILFLNILMNSANGTIEIDLVHSIHFFAYYLTFLYEVLYLMSFDRRLELINLTYLLLK